MPSNRDTSETPGAEASNENDHSGPASESSSQSAIEQELSDLAAGDSGNAGRTESDENEGSWWRRRCGGREVLALTLPLVISTGSLAMLLYFDRMFLFWYSPDAIAAAMPSGTMYWTWLCAPMGIVGFTNTLVAQYYGANRPQQIGASTWQGMLFGLLLIPLYPCLIPVTRMLFSWGEHSAEVLHLEVVYFQTLMWGAGAAVLSAAQSSFFTGRGKTVIVMIVDSASVLLNIVLDYILIFGMLGLPELGIVGAGWGTVISIWAKVVVYQLLMERRDLVEQFHLRTTRRFDWDLMGRLLKFGTPSGMQMLIEAGAFTFLVMLMGRLGEHEVTAGTIAMSLNAVAFVPMIGFSIAASTLVGQQITQGRTDLAARATWTSLVFGCCFSAVFTILYVAFPDYLLAGHAAGVSQEDFAATRRLAIVMLRFIAAYCVLDGIQIVFVGALRGAGDTLFVMIVSAITGGLCCVVCWFVLPLGWVWWWFTITGWICSLAIIYAIRFVMGNWKHMKVIEDAAE